MVVVLDETVQCCRRPVRSRDVNDRLVSCGGTLAGSVEADKPEVTADASRDFSADPQATAAHTLPVAVMAVPVSIVLRALHQGCDEWVPLRRALLPERAFRRVALFPRGHGGRQGKELGELERRSGVVPPAGHLPLRDPGKLLPREGHPGGESQRGRGAERLPGRGIVGKVPDRSG